MRRAVKISAMTLAGLLVLLALLGSAVWIAANTDAGRLLIERVTARLTSGHVQLSGLGGSFPSQLTLDRLELRDKQGVWLTADRISLRWSILRLLERRIQVDTLHVARIQMQRKPVGDPKAPAPTVPHIEVGAFQLDTVDLGAALAGRPARLSLRGRLVLRSLQDADTDITAHRLDGDGDYVLRLKFDAHRMDASLNVHEPASGPLENILSLPGLGALAASVELHGPRESEHLELSLQAGNLRAAASGSLNLRDQSAELTYSLQAPSMTPRPDLAWDNARLNGNWHGPWTSATADGVLTVDSLRIGAGTQIARLSSALAVRSGKLSAHALIDGLQIPGPHPRLLTDHRLMIDAAVALDKETRPIEVTASHAMFKLLAHADMGSLSAHEQRATVELSVPELSPFAELAAQNLRGSGTASAIIVHTPGDTALDLRASLGLNGGSAAWLPIVGPRLAIQLKGVLNDGAIGVDSLTLSARALNLKANGTATRTHEDAPAPALRDVKARWQLSVSDLSVVSKELAGTMNVSGKLSGPLNALLAQANAAGELSVRGSPSGALKADLQARGLPNVSSAALQAHGMIDGSPLDVDAELDRQGPGSYRWRVRRGTWKSAQVQGDLLTHSRFADSRGQMQLQVGQLGDFNRLLGSSLSGAIDGIIHVVPGSGQTQAEIQLEGKDLVFGQFAGNVHLKATGAADALDVMLSANLPTLYGKPADIEAAGRLETDARRLHLERFSLAHRGETVRLMAPADLIFSPTIKTEGLQLADRKAVLEVSGQFAPLLDLRASLTGLGPDVVNAFMPDLLAGGVMNAQLRLQGTAADLNGTVRIDALGVRFADDAATGLPGMDLHAKGTLSESVLALDGSLSAGTASQLSLSGTAPLSSGGELNLKLDGKLDMGLANPLLEARGLHTTGHLAIAATATGTRDAPVLGGGLTLSQGSLRDYGRGVNLSKIEAEFTGDNSGLLIKKFNATAVSGNIGMTGRIALLDHGIPVDLKITAKNAQPIASNLVTANLDADISITGTARERINVAGTVNVNRATIGIPNSLPPEVAVLDVRRRGKAAATPTGTPLVIGINVAVEAPQEILVQGRGLDAELGGRIKLSGTAADLIARGGFNLQRGRFTLGGSKLEFTSDSRVGFDGAGLRKKIDPTLDFTANTTVGDTTATLRITGQADAPRFEFTSVPQLPQDEIMALLLFGKPAQQLSAFELAQIGAALAEMSGVGGSLNPLAKIQKSLGLDRLTVAGNTSTTATGTENQGAAIAAGRYISKRIYIEGKQTTTGNSQVQVDVDLTKHLKLQTRIGNGTAITQGTTPDNDPGNSIGLQYQFEY